MCTDEGKPQLLQSKGMDNDQCANPNMSCRLQQVLTIFANVYTQKHLILSLKSANEAFMLKS